MDSQPAPERLNVAGGKHKAELSRARFWPQTSPGPSALLGNHAPFPRSHPNPTLKGHGFTSPLFLQPPLTLSWWTHLLFTEKEKQVEENFLIHLQMGHLPLPLVPMDSAFPADRHLLPSETCSVAGAPDAILNYLQRDSSPGWSIRPSVLALLSSVSSTSACKCFSVSPILDNLHLPW